MQNNKRIAKNTLFLYVRMFFVLIVSLYTSRVILNTLGVVDYGIYNVVAGFVSLFTFINATLSSSIQRFYNYEGVKNAARGFQNVYITGIIIHLIIVILVFIILETFGVWYINNVLVLPDDRLQAANVVYQTSVISLIIVLMQIPYVGAIMAKEHMGFYALTSIVDVVLRLMLVLILPHVSYDKLISWSVFSLLINIVGFILYYVYSKLWFPEIRFRFKLDKELFKSILNFSGWNIVGTFIFMLKGQGLNMLLNFYFGPVVNAARGIAYQVNNAVGGFSQNITVAFRPQIVNAYADNAHTAVRDMMYMESKICFMLIATLIVPVMIEIDYVLHLWLGNGVPDNTGLFVRLVLLDTLLCTLNTPCTQVVQATGNIKSYQIVSALINVFLLPISWIFLKLGHNASVVFIVTIVMSVINQIACLIVTNKIFPIDFNEYGKNVLLSCGIFAILLPILPYIVFKLVEPSFCRLVLLIVCDIVVAFLLVYWLALDRNQRLSLKNLFISKFVKNA